LLLAVLVAPPFSIILFYYVIKTYFKKYDHPVFIPVLLFIIGHCLIGHKEERFLYPVFSALPIIAGYALPGLIYFLSSTKRWVASFIKLLFIISIVLNTIVLILFTLIPYSQTIYFSKLLKNEFEERPATVYCLVRTPFETMSGIPMVFYRKGAPNLILREIATIDSVRYLNVRGTFVATTFNESKEKRPLLDSLGFKPILYSSGLLWKINEFLDSKKINTINDIWVLYKKE
jgi:phosphatidylinositol glycan class B